MYVRGALLAFSWNGFPAPRNSTLAVLSWHRALDECLHCCLHPTCMPTEESHMYACILHVYDDCRTHAPFGYYYQPADTLLIFCFAGRLPSSFLMHERLLHGFPVHDRWPRGDLIRACMVLRIRGPRPALKSLRKDSMVVRRLRVVSLPWSCHAHSMFRCWFCRSQFLIF